MNPKKIHVLKETLFALRQLCDEIPEMKRSTVIYFPDFNLLHPYVYSQSQSRYRLTDTFGKCLFTLMTRVRLPNTVCMSISLPTIMEFIFSVQSYYEIFNTCNSNKELSNYIYNCINDLQAGKISISDIKSERVKRFILSENTIGGVDKKVGSFISMFRSNKIDLLTDHYSADQINRLIHDNANVLRTINRSIASDRNANDTRNSLSKALSYKVDAHNVFLPILNSLGENKSTNFVCSTKFNRWAPSDILKDHQRLPLFLIMLIGTLGQLPQAMPLTEKLSQLATFAETALCQGTLLLEKSSRDTFSLDLERQIDAFNSSHLDYYIAMTKKISTTDDDESEPLPIGTAVSYQDYREIGSIRRNKVTSQLRTIHELIDDSTDDMYRDFVDDARFRKAFPSLKLG